ncbi:MAG: segregation ATPase FtsK/SpoIIIE, family, partial [Frankiaceae bacterium]|nr:segregation ATPase FtsK/SpoIIIE, family [Frankiaceae bacterium]
LLGLAADSLRLVTLPRARISRPFVVVGSIGSGRSTALLLIAAQLADRQVAVCCNDTSPLAACPGAVRLPRDDQDHAVAVLDSLGSSGSPPHLVCDDVDLLAEGPLSTRLDALARDDAGNDAALAIGASTDAVAAAFRGPLAHARRSRCGLLLGAVTRHDAEVLGVTLAGRAPSRIGDPPGRGWLVVAGNGQRLQLADPTGQQLENQLAGLELSA